MIFALLLLIQSAFAGSPPPAVIIWKSSCNSGAFNLSSQTCIQQGSFAQVESAGATTIDWSKQANIYTLTLNANVAITFTGAVAGETILVQITNTASNYTVTWSTTVAWPLATNPVQTVGAHTDIYAISYDGTTYRGSYVQDY